jgi:hypothetical protein
MREHNLKGLEKNESRPIHAAGVTMIYLKSAPNDAIIKIDNSQDLEMPEGGKLKLVSPVKSEISIENTGLKSDFSIVVGNGDYEEPQVAGTVALKSNNTINGLTSLTFDTQAKTVRGDAKRKELHIQSKSTNAGLIWLGSSDGLTGLPLEASQTVVLEISGDLSLFAESLNDVVYLAEVV